jgi:hypothetical protein
VCILHSLFLHLNNYDAETSIKCIVQGHEENSNRKPVFNKSVSIKRLSESVNFRGRSILVGFKTKNKQKSLPTDPNFEELAIGNTHLFFWPYE